MIREPLVSVILPVYNGEAYLAEAIRSVFAGSYGNMEIIIVDDGSTDRSADVAQQFGPGIRYFYQRNQGASAARNQGVRQAQGQFLSFIDADDLWTNDKLARQMAELEKDSKLDAVSGLIEQFYTPECPTERKPDIYQGYLPGSILIRHESFLRVGYFQTGLQLGEVVDWVSRFRDAGMQMLIVPHVMYRRRIHKNNQGVTKQQHRVEYARILKAALDRKRAQRVEENQ